MKSNQLSREEWLSHVSSSKASGLSLSAYCRKHGLNRSFSFSAEWFSLSWFGWLC